LTTTLKMRGIIVSDTSCLILFHKINRIDILKSVFGTIYITTEIAKEFDEALPDFIKIQNPKDPNYQKILERYLDSGEASAIALAIEIVDCLLIIDEVKARREAKSLNITFTGTLGVLLIAKENGVINSVKEIIDLIKKTNFRISDTLIQDVLIRCGEYD
jgi:predicted nucleic acid-binding protein